LDSKPLRSPLLSAALAVGLLNVGVLLPAVIVRSAVRPVLLDTAVKVTILSLATARVVTVKVELVAPAGTVTLAGTVATLVSLLTSETTVPPLGAGALKVTLPVEGFPPTTVVGLSDREVTVGSELGTISRSALWPGLPSRWALTFRLNCEDTGDVEMVKLALVAPAGTVTL